jgi:hypothetical protein
MIHVLLVEDEKPMAGVYASPSPSKASPFKSPFMARMVSIWRRSFHMMS